MSFKNLKITTYQDSVSALPDYPSDAGITAAQLKAVFDGRTDKEIKQKFNALIDELITKFGLVEVDIADAVEEHQQWDEAHSQLFSPINERIAEIIGDMITLDTNIAEHAGNRDNPHEVTAEQVGLDKVDNTPDNEKYVAYASNAGYALNAEFDLLGNPIHEHYATKDEVGKVDLSEYYTKTESDGKFVGNDVYNADLGYLDGAIGVNSDRIDQLVEDVGKIDTALDSILAIQNELIGG